MKIEFDEASVSDGAWCAVYFPSIAVPCRWLSWSGDDEYVLSSVPRLTRNRQWAYKHYGWALRVGTVLHDWDVEFRKVYAFKEPWEHERP
jgi:hypothetical protein